MAEYIDIDTPLELKVVWGQTYKPYTSTLRDLLDVNSIPYTAADVRPVVLCRDCDMYECHEYDGGLKYVCWLFKRQMQEADFCSYGVKKEES